MITIKNVEVLQSLMTVPVFPVLRSLVAWVAARRDMIITCAYEKRDYASVHSMNPVRGVDLRSSIYANPQVVADQINSRWTYDPARPELKCALFHDTGRGNHLHLQACENTRLNAEGGK